VLLAELSGEQLFPRCFFARSVFVFCDPPCIWFFSLFFFLPFFVPTHLESTLCFERDSLAKFSLQFKLTHSPAPPFPSFSHIPRNHAHLTSSPLPAAPPHPPMPPHKFFHPNAQHRCKAHSPGKNYVTSLHVALRCLMDCALWFFFDDGPVCARPFSKECDSTRGKTPVTPFPPSHPALPYNWSNFRPLYWVLCAIPPQRP